jgi:glycosyltransferase involved in cell wall biosynthesis
MRNLALRVAWDNSMSGRDRAGTGIYASRLIRELSDNSELEIKAFNGPQGSWAQRLLWYHWQFPRVLRQDRFDLLHGPAFVLPLRSPCPSVVTVHDLTSRIFPEHFDRPWRVYVNRIMPHTLGQASAIICVSEHSRKDLLKFYPVSRGKVHVVYHGIDHNRFHPGATLDSQWAQTFGLREGYVLHVGTFSHRKNIPTLLRAISHLRSKGKWGTRQLVLAGSQSEGMKGVHEVYDTIRELELGSSVVLTGYVPNDQVPGLYAHASALVMPSLYEGFGFPVLESMAVGTPVIASNSSSLPEVAEDAAILVPPQDVEAWAKAIEDVIESPTISSELQRKGLARARQFSWERTAEQTVAVYRSVASG